MQIKRILNQVQKFKSHIYDRVEFEDGGRTILAWIKPRANGKTICSGCFRPRPVYDTSREPRRFQFVPLWGIPVFFLYHMRRVHCDCCGVVVELVPWAEGKRRITTAYAWFLATWAKRLAWKQVAQAFTTSWDTVARSVHMAVEWGLDHRVLDGVGAIGIDEIAWKKGHKYVTLVYQIDANCRRLLWIGQGRSKDTLRRFFDELSHACRQLEFVCSDMWKPYLDVVAERAGEALQVLDRFHIVSHLNKAINKVRAQEARTLKSRGHEPVLKGTRFLLLKRPENLSPDQEIKLADLLRHNLRSVRAYLLKEDFDFFWSYISPYWAGRFLDRWCSRAMRSRIEPIKKVARTLRRHRTLLLNWFRARGQISSGIVEGFNNKAKVTTRNAYGYRSLKHLKAALFHALGDLPEPEFAHRFC